MNACPFGVTLQVTVYLNSLSSHLPSRRSVFQLSHLHLQTLEPLRHLVDGPVQLEVLGPLLGEHLLVEVALDLALHPSVL